MNKAKTIGFITVILIIFILILWAFKIVSDVKNNQKEEASYIKYESQNIDMQLNSDYLEYLPLNEEYIEKGAKAITKDKQDISLGILITYYKNNIQVARIETDDINNYLVKYTAIDPNTNKTTSIYKTVIIIDNKKEE